MREFPRPPRLFPLPEPSEPTSSFASFARFVILIFDPAAGARFQTSQDRTNISLIDTNYQSLLFSVVIHVAESDEVFTGFTEQQNRRDQDRGSIPPAHV